MSTGVSPTGVATGSAGNAYFSSVNAVFKIDASGTLTHVAGTGKRGYSGDGGPATSAQLNGPTGLAVDAAGNVYIADYRNNRVRRVAPNGIITTIAGSGREPDPADGITTALPDSGDGGPAVNAVLDGPTAVAVDAAGNLYIGDNVYGIVRKVAPSGIISTVAGGGNNSPGAGLATDAKITVSGLAVDGAGNLYIATGGGDGRVLKVDTNGVLSIVAGGGTNMFCNGGRATSSDANAGFVAVDSAGDLYITSFGEQICKVASNGIISPVNVASGPGFSGDGGPAMSAQIKNPLGVAVDVAGNIFIADFGNLRVRRIDGNGIMSTVAGNGSLGYSGDGGPATSARLNETFGVAVDASGDVYIANSGNNCVRKVTADGIISTVAGNGSFGHSGDGGPATAAQLQAPRAVAVDGAGNLYIVDSDRVRKVSADGMISIVGIGGTLEPSGLAVDAAGNLYIADDRGSRVRKVSANGIVTIVAGNGTSGFSGDGGPATSASLWGPKGIAFDAMGNLFIADSLGGRVRKVSASGIINTVAGEGPAGSASNQSGPATSAFLWGPQGVAVDGSGNLYIADGTSRLQKVTGDGTISTVAGNFTIGYSGDGGLAANASMGIPDAVAVDGSGDIYVADFSNNVIRMLKPTNQSVLISAVMDAASESATAISPGKIVAIYGSGLGPATLAQNQPSSGVFGEQIGGTNVTFNGIPAPIIYASSTQVAAIAPYGISGSATAQVVVTSTSGVSTPFVVPVAASAPSFFSANASGAGQIAAVNLNGSLNDAAQPVSIGGYVSLYATGEGQTSPAGVDGKLALNPPYPAPALPVSVTIGGVTVTPAYAGAAPQEVAGLMQVVVQIPPNVQPGGYVPVVLTVGNASTVNGAAWIAVAGN